MSDRAKIREIFLANGFTIKPGHYDLKEYVYEAAEKLLEYQLAALKEESERLKDDLVSNMIAKEERIDALSERCADAEAEVCRLDRQVNALKTKAKARVAELERLLRDIKQHDIDETTKRILDDGRKFNYSLPLNIRERIDAALKDEFAAFKLATAETAQVYIQRIDSLKKENERLKEDRNKWQKKYILLEDRVAELEKERQTLADAAYSAIIAFNNIQDESLDGDARAHALLKHTDCIRNLWNIFATQDNARFKEPANEG